MRPQTSHKIGSMLLLARTALILLLLLSIIYTGIAASPTSNPEIAGRGYYGGIAGYNKTIDIVDTDSPPIRYAYIGEGSGLVILNVTNYEEVHRLSRVNLLEVLEDIQVVGHTVYVADGWGGLFILDASDVNSPVILHNWSNGSNPLLEVQVTDDNATAYLAGADSGLIILDVSDPANPFVLGQYDTPGSVYGLHVVGGRAYLADSDQGLRILDVSDPAHITSLGVLDTPGQTLGVRVDSDRAYLGDGANGLVIADISDPASPALITTVDTTGEPASAYPGEASRLQMVGDYVFIADFARGLQKIDVNPSSEFYGEVVGNMPSVAREVEVVGSTVYSASGNEVFFNSFNLGDPTGRYATGQGQRVAKEGDLVLLSAGWGGLFLIDAADPQNLAYHSLFEDLAVPANDVAVDGIRAFVGTGEEVIEKPLTIGVITVDISNPDHPVRLVGELYVTYPEPVRGLKAADGYIYAATSSSGLLIIRYPDIPYTLAGEYDTPGYAYDVFLSDDHNTAYVADGSGGLQILDVTDKSQPALLGNLVTVDARAVQVAGDYAYLAAESAGFYIIDVSNPAQPVELSHLVTDTPVNNVSVRGNLVFLASESGGIQVVNINDPAHPKITASWDTPGLAKDVLGDGDVRYIADGVGGLQVLRPVSASAEIDNNGGEMQADDDSVTVTFPAGAVSEPVQVAYSGLYAPSQVLPTGVSTPVISFNLQAQTSGGQAVTQFAAPLTLTIHYLQSLLDERGLDERDLKIIYWSSAQAEWVQVFPCEECSQDMQSDTVTLVLDHFSEFALVADQSQKVFVPVLHGKPDP